MKKEEEVRAAWEASRAEEAAAAKVKQAERWETQIDNREPYISNLKRNLPKSKAPKK
ncbi:MAG: hypothetical protein H7Y20_06170 [Bryobacteraceae bacterium]|nr:hypothetical protein [Bryobacteraceae bacterium]